MDFKTGNCRDRKRLLEEIGKVDFAAIELTLYLDTHPYDQQAIDAFKGYQLAKKQLMKEYTDNYGPLTLDSMDDNMREWKWALQDWPWERGYH